MELLVFFVLLREWWIGWWQKMIVYVHNSNIEMWQDPTQMVKPYSITGVHGSDTETTR